MRMGRTLTLLSIFAGIATWYATRAAMRRAETTGVTTIDESLRWEEEGGASPREAEPPAAAAF